MMKDIEEAKPISKIQLSRLQANENRGEQNERISKFLYPER